MKKHQMGNVLVYILVAIVLFAALGVTFTRQLGQGGVSSRMDSDRADLQASEVLQYATSVRNVVEQMVTLGHVQPQDIDFVQFGETGFDDAPYGAKVHHPAGGGLSVFLGTDALLANGSAERGWHVQNNSNVSWSYTDKTDVLYSFIDIDPMVCAAINKRLYNDATIPVYNGAAANVFMLGGSDADFDSANCAGCAGRASLCVRDSAGAHVFYNVILAR